MPDYLEGVPLMLVCTGSDAAAVKIARSFVENYELDNVFRWEWGAAEGRDEIVDVFKCAAAG